MYRSFPTGIPIRRIPPGWNRALNYLFIPLNPGRNPGVMSIPHHIKPCMGVTPEKSPNPQYFTKIAHFVFRNCVALSELLFIWSFLSTQGCALGYLCLTPLGSYSQIYFPITVRWVLTGSAKFILTLRKSAKRSHRDSPGRSPGEMSLPHHIKPWRGVTPEKSPHPQYFMNIAHFILKIVSLLQSSNQYDGTFLPRAAPWATYVRPLWGLIPKFILLLRCDEL